MQQQQQWSQHAADKHEQPGLSSRHVLLTLHSALVVALRSGRLLLLSAAEAGHELYGTSTTDRSSAGSSPRKRRCLSKNAASDSPEAVSKVCSSASGSRQASSKPEASRKQPDMRLEE